ncbi:hypothetical protein [Hymenobacter baengnokdamensis]|uniref:hypothetical protein n=1 Tax=Hymenobacter baengnokdamensis TaxID=2615203 RepID=UPI0012471EF8|nr:hypothetical protein [Hymenobacter baengnokdamensis]
MRISFIVLLLAWVFSPVRAQVYYLNLHGQHLELPERKIAIEQVVDGREGHPAIGIVYHGLGNKAVAVLFRHSLEEDLTAFVQTQLPARPTDQRVLLCVRQLRVSEEIGSFSEKKSADLALDVYIHLPDGYHFTQSTGAHTSDKAFDGTHSHPANLALLLTKCLRQFTTADWSAATSRPALTLAQVPTDLPAALAGGGRRGPAPPILREPLRRGIYYQFEQFLANRPDTSLAFTLDTLRLYFRSPLAAAKWLGVARVRPLVTAAGTRHPSVPTGMWGFCDGKQLFVQYNKQFFPLMRQGSYFTFVGEAPADVNYARARANAQARAQFTVVAPVGVDDHTAEPMAYALDMRTGELAPYPGLRAPTRYDTAYVYVYRPVSKATAPVMVLINGREAGRIQPGEYLEIPWTQYAKPLRLCLDGLPMHAPCQYLVPNTARQSYLKVDSQSPGPAWQWMTSTQGEADLNELDKLRK